VFWTVEVARKVDKEQCAEPAGQMGLQALTPKTVEVAISGATRPDYGQAGWLQRGWRGGDPFRYDRKRNPLLTIALQGRVHA